MYMEHLCTESRISALYAFKLRAAELAGSPAKCGGPGIAHMVLKEFSDAYDPL